MSLTPIANPYWPDLPSMHWTATVSFQGLSAGEKILTAVATDVLGNSAFLQLPLVYAPPPVYAYPQPPTLTVTAPGADVIARPFVRVNATCVDDDPEGCTFLRVYEVIDGATILRASGRSRIDQSVALTGSNALRFVAEDSDGQTVSTDRLVPYGASAGLIEVVRIDSEGSISVCDMQGDNLLYLETVNGTSTLSRLNLTSSVSSLIPTPSFDGQLLVPRCGRLTPRGAIFPAFRNNEVTTGGVYDWRDGGLVECGLPNAPDSLRVKGTYAIWSGEVGHEYTGTGQSSLFVRDLVDGRTTVVAADVGNTNNDVAPNGDVVFWGRDYQIYRYRDGTTTRLSDDTQAWNTYPVTDGQTVLFRTLLFAPFGFTITAHDSGGLTTIAQPREPAPQPGADYQVINGHVAFTRPGVAGAAQVWVDSRQVSDFASSSGIDLLASNGEVTFANDGSVYLVRGTAPPVPFPLPSGRRFHDGSQWYVALGSCLFRFDPEVPEPTIASVSPTSVVGSAHGFTLTVRGHSFLPTATVFWNGEARPTTFIDSTHLSAVINASDTTTPGSASVVVVQAPNGGGGHVHSYVDVTLPALAVHSIAPTFGPAEGGTRVSLSGSGFAKGATVTIGGVVAVDVDVVNSTLIEATTPTHDVGVATVAVTNPDAETQLLADAFAFVGQWSVNSTRYFAEGAANWFFDCYFALVNPDPNHTASATLRFLREDGVNFAYPVTVPPRTRQTVDAKEVPGLAPAVGFSTVIESDRELVADRTMTWMPGTGYGSHAETGVSASSERWYLAEGATHSGFQLYYLIQNPNDVSIDVEITYLRKPPSPPITITYRDIAPRSRRTILVNAEHPGLASEEISGVVTSLTHGASIIVERAMYLDSVEAVSQPPQRDKRSGEVHERSVH
jgi:hypothetical protein